MSNPAPGANTKFQPRKERARLRNDVFSAIALKILAIVVLFIAFFSASHRPPVSLDSMFGPDASKVDLPTTNN